MQQAQTNNVSQEEDNVFEEYMNTSSKPTYNRYK